MLNKESTFPRLCNLIAQIPARLEKAQVQLEATKQQMAAAKEKLGKPFPQEEEYRIKSVRLAELDVELNMDSMARKELHLSRSSIYSRHEIALSELQGILQTQST